MNKKMLTAAILAAMTLSTASVFASPVILSGDARVDYLKQGDAGDLTNRIRLNVDTTIGDSLYVHGRVNLENNMETNEANTSLNQAYIGGALSGLNFKVGKQPLFLGKGMLADTDGSNGLMLSNSGEGARVNAFIGKDHEKALGAANISSALGQFNVGASYLKVDTNKYLGFNADTKISNNAALNLEYVKHQDSDAKGYLAEVVFGNAAKKGDADYSISYRNIDNGTVDNAYSTDTNYNNSKGVKVKTHYKVTDNATLGVYYDMAKDQNGNDKHRTEVEFGVNF